MSITTVILIGVLVAIVVVGIAAWIFLQKRWTKKLRARFRQEYFHTLQESGIRRVAKARLEERKNESRVFISDHWCQAIIPASEILEQGAGSVR